MAASVRIEDEAFSDERYEDLAQLAGLTDADHARGKMARLWRQCTLEGTHTLSNQMVSRVLGPNGIQALVQSRLGEQIDDFNVRIRGTQGRIEWLQKLRDNGKKGGRPPKLRVEPPAKPKGKPSGSPELNPPAPSPAPSPSVPETLSLARATPPCTLEDRQKLNREVWDYARLQHDLLRSVGVDPHAISWTAAPMGAGGDDFTARVRELGDNGGPDYVREVMFRVVDVAVAEAKREGHLRWFTAKRMWDRDRFWLAAETSPEQAAVPKVRAGPRGTRTNPDEPSPRGRFKLL